jgi:Arc/MetJ-type ribon-helix-helix transcriptional regulator
MVKVTVEIPNELGRQIERIVRDGWFPDQESIIRAALQQFVEGKSFLGDSPRMLHRFAADSLNESKPEVALKFLDRAISLNAADKLHDLNFYRTLVELRVQVLLVLRREDEAVATLEEARELLPNNPTIARWLERLNRKRAEG